MARKLKKGLEVVVITGPENGKRGKVLEIRPNDRIIVEGIALRKKHERPSEDNKEGGIVEREGSIHISNVMSAEKYDLKQKKQTV